MENLKLLRNKKKMSQVSLQIKTGIDQSLISKYENDERLPTCENLLILAEFFGTSTDYLLGLTEIEEPYQRIKKT